MSHVLANHFKTAALLGVLIALFVFAGYQLGGGGGMIIALLIGGAMNVGAWFFSDTLAIRAMRAKEIHADGSGPRVPGVMPNEQLYAMVDRLRQRANLPMPRVYICPHDAPNAFATGRSPRRSAVAVTQGLLRLMNEQEVEGVIAHELAHIKNRDTAISCVAATIAGVLAFVAQWFFFIGGRREGNPLVTFGVLILAAVGAAMIKAMISRSREYIADADGAGIAGSPDGLASGLARLDAYSKQIPLVQPNPAQNNLFIVEPLAGGGRSLVNLFATHPPTESRIAALRRLR